MLALLADENFNGRIQMGLRPRLPDVDLVSVQELGMRQVDDPEILERAAQERRIVLTHDANTVPGFAFERLKAGGPMPGVVGRTARLGGDRRRAGCL